MKNDEIGTSAMAAMLNMSKTTFASTIEYVEGFPLPVRMAGNRRVYSLSQFKTWMKKHDNPAETIRQIHRSRDAVRRVGDNPATEKFNAMARAFIARPIIVIQQD